MTTAYITQADIKDELARNFDLTDYLTEANQEIEDLAETLGVFDPDDIKTPVHNKVRRYGVVFCLKRLFEDKSNMNEPDASGMDDYEKKSAKYQRQVMELQSRISQEMITGTVDQMSDRSVYSGIIYRM